jgi:hypothetical protein
MECNSAAHAEIGYTWDCRPRYRIRSKTEKVERVVTQEQICRGG